MRRIFRVLVVLAFLLSAIGCLAASGGAEKAPQADAPLFFPWSDTSPYVRVPKSFLHEINIWSVTISNYETMEFVVTEEFVNLCAVTPSERTKLTAAVANARHEYYLAKAKHWAPSEDKASLGGWESTVLERFDFKQDPIPEVRAAIYQALQQQVLAILGEERAGFFWDFGGMLDSENTGFGREFEAPPGQKSSTTFSFLLRSAEQGLEIDLFMETVTGGPGRGGGQSSSGGPYVQVFDQYAPESMKPVLARWRKAIADAKTSQTQTGTSAQRPLAHAEGNRAVPPTNDRPALPRSPGDSATAAKWENGSPFVDVPKGAIKLFRISGLNVDQEVSDEAVILFGLTASERQGIDELFKKMKARFEQLERSHFERTNTAANSFVIRAFPDQAKALQEEWTRKLGGIVGIPRAALLDETIRTPSAFRFRRGVPMFDGMRRADGPDWLHRGMAETQLDVSMNTGPNGQPAIQRIQWTTQGGERGSAGGATIPERWRHLLTPDMLKPATGGR
jgi:hypothetical protein